MAITNDSLSHKLDNNNNSNESSVNYSGNSDVDVTIEIDTRPIAYAMLCSLLATKQISTEDFELAVSKLDTLTKKKEVYSVRGENDVSKVQLFNNRRRRR
ncbi:hypothetical protein CHH83_20775 [Bacillus sp. 7586-K]|nr:hypothetical protein CHH83_20775 [Bacillus sp. 7586-K]